MRFFASCSKGLEYLLVDELMSLGVHATAAVAGVNATGELADAQRAVLWSRIASRVLWPLTEFECPDEAALYAGTAEVDWTAHIRAGHTLAVDAHVGGSAITHARFAAQRVKDAVVDTLRTARGTRPDVDVDAPDVRLHLVVRKARATVSIDLAGGPMHRRGWRLAQGEAPLKETLAAGVLMRGQWPRVYAGGGALLDPMCGSGTLLVEGALMAADVAPGLMRHGDTIPTQWPGFDRDHWVSLIADARTRERAGRAALRRAFVGRDIDPHAVRDAKDNAARAGLADVIDLAVADIAALQVGDVARLERPAHDVAAQGVDVANVAAVEAVDAVAAPGDIVAPGHAIDPGSAGHAPAPAGMTPRAPGLVVCNPPYDARLAADAGLYRALGDALQRATPTWRASLLCGDAHLARATGLRAQKTYQVFNSAIECTLLVCDPVARLQRPVATSATPAALSEGAQMVANRLRRNLRKLKAWKSREGVECYRAYDADLPEYAAAIDVYTESGSGQVWLHVQEYAGPADIPEADQRTRLDALVAAAREVFAVAHERVALKTRSKGKGGSKYGQFEQRNARIEVREGEARLLVNLFDYLDTGVFLDHRPLRQRLFEESHDTRFLNLFAYTGAATVQAALGGARTTTSVDLSGTYLQWCADNLQANGIGGAKHRLVQADAIAWLQAETGQFDLVFCDPPTFSNSKRASDFDIQREHVDLLSAIVERLAPGGVLYFSNNFRRFKLDDAVHGFAQVEDISASTIPPDFERNARIHRCWRITRR